ncbi:uncharacterized protein [Rutidosis leptorrhynchoides]|uniref:uncharacterized protein n=1 Tax=Rutidosis leptorrhynchoides TaxID=125765 RepID=UPI003A994282
MRVVQMGNICSGSWSWIRSPSGRALGELESLTNLINSFVFNNSDEADSWMWKMAPNGRFTTKLLNETIEEVRNMGSSLRIKTQRNYLTPKKVEVFIWRARLRRLPIRVELDKRGVDLDSVLCRLCNNGIESVEHTLILCQQALEVWERVVKWCGLSNVTNLSIGEAFLGRSTQQLSPIQKDVWQVVEWTCGYLIWKNRNQKIFKNKSWNGALALNKIQIKSFDWISRRIKGKSVDWLSWLSNLISCI